jgi:catechol 2,3-dioxygenase-like lactoylglutathione lyase family enzyme
MIKAVHVLVYSADPAADRAFLRDVLGWPHVADPGSEPGWLIFKLPPAELGVHPEMGAGPVHELSLVCDDVEATVADLAARGVVFTRPVTDAGFGLTTMLRLPGGGELQLYQPKHATAYDL